MTDLSNSYGSKTCVEYQEQAPILHRCAAWRRRRLADHRDWVGELERSRAAGAVPDEYYFAALELEPMLDRDESVST
jgi:hypothetical protein